MTEYTTQKEAVNSGETGHLILNPSVSIGHERTKVTYHIKDVSGDNWTQYREAGRLIGWVEGGKLSPINNL